jgi:hypothetical protein
MYIYYISLYFQLLAGLLPIIFYFNKLGKENLELLILFCASFIATLSILFTYQFKINNHNIFNAYVIIEFCCISVFYSKLFKLKYSKLIKLLIIPFLFLFFFEIYQNDVIILGSKLTSLTYIIYSISFFIKYLNISRRSNEYKFSQAINASLFIYNCSAFILIFYIMKLMNSNLWYVHNFIEGSSKLLIAYALWKLPKTAHS